MKYQKIKNLFYKYESGYPKARLFIEADHGRRTE